ncbi:programmed cell death 1 ligand 1-like isoform X2 [Dendrobates tinctorius]
MAAHSNFLIAVLLWKCCTIISGLFTVEAKKSNYIALYGSNVSMECQFALDMGTDVEKLNILWKHIREKMDAVEVVKHINGKDIEILQDKNYSDRIKLLSNELHNGRAILHINEVKMTDAGQYLCIITSHGSDYKVLKLDVQAPYKNITTQVRDVVNSSGQKVREVSCQSFGYPKANVTWVVDKENLTVVQNISYTITADRLFNVTSVVRIPGTSSTTLTCTFWNEINRNETSLTFTVSEPVKNEKSQEWKLSFVSLAILIVIVVSTAVGFGQYKRVYQKRTGFNISRCTNDTLSINDDTLATSKYSSDHFGNISVNSIVDVENTVTKLLSSS